MTSSKMSSAPDESHSPRSSARKPSAAGIHPARTLHGLHEHTSDLTFSAVVPTTGTECRSHRIDVVVWQDHKIVAARSAGEEPWANDNTPP